MASEAYEATDERLIRIKGLVIALETLALHHDGLDGPSPQSDALFAIIDALERTAQQALDLHQAELDAGRQAVA